MWQPPSTMESYPSKSTNRSNNQWICSNSMCVRHTNILLLEDCGFMDHPVLENPITHEKAIRIHISSLKANGGMDILANLMCCSMITIILVLDTSSRSGVTNTLVQVKSKEELSLYCTETLSLPLISPSKISTVRKSLKLSPLSRDDSK